MAGEPSWKTRICQARLRSQVHRPDYSVGIIQRRGDPVGIIQNCIWGVPIVAQGIKNPASTHEDTDSISRLAQWVKGSGIVMSCVGRRHLAQIQHCYGCGVGWHL